MSAGGKASSKRAAHFFSECSRVLQGVELWKSGSLEAYGALMNQSSQSSMQSYEVQLGLQNSRLQCNAGNMSYVHAHAGQY